MDATDPKSMQFEPGTPQSGDIIPLCVPELRGNEWRYIKECLDTNWVSSVGSFVDRFERGLADYVGTEYAVAVVNGTAALHIALLIAGVEPDDEVLVSDLTFIAPANAIRYVGAWPVFIDAEPQYWQMDPERVLSFLAQGCRWRDGALYNKTTSRRVKAILPVHILGHPVDMDPILEAARKYNLRVIEDATESLGARYKGNRVGSLGDVACFSFNGNKIITTGGGGMIVTDNPDWARRAKYLTTQAKDDPLEYVHNELGYNYRLTNLQAAMGVAQLEQLDDYIAAKRHIASVYSNEFVSVAGIKLLGEAPWATSIYWLSTVLIDSGIHTIDSRRLLAGLGKCNIQSRPLWQPLHKSPVYSSLKYSCPVSEELNYQALTLPSSVGLADEEVRTVAKHVMEILIT